MGICTMKEFLQDIENLLFALLIDLNLNMSIMDTWTHTYMYSDMYTVLQYVGYISHVLDSVRIYCCRGP